MLTYELISRPSKSALAILQRKACDKIAANLLADKPAEAVGLIQGPVAPIIAAADIAEKAANVIVSEIAGSCPQHITLIAVLGELSAVKIALEAVKSKKSPL